MKHERFGIILAVLLLAAVLVACGQKSVQDEPLDVQTPEPSDAEIEQVENDLNEIVAIEELDESELEGLDEDLAQI